MFFCFSPVAHSTPVREEKPSQGIYLFCLSSTHLNKIKYSSDQNILGSASRGASLPHIDGINSSSYQSVLTLNTDSPTVQYPVPSSPTAPPLHDTLRSFHSPDRPPQVASLVVGSSTGNSHPQSQFSQLASSERSDRPREPTSGESLQKPGLPGPSSAVLPGTVWCR